MSKDEQRQVCLAIGTIQRSMGLTPTA